MSDRKQASGGAPKGDRRTNREAKICISREQAEERRRCGVKGSVYPVKVGTVEFYVVARTFLEAAGLVALHYRLIEEPAPDEDDLSPDHPPNGD